MRTVEVPRIGQRIAVPAWSICDRERMVIESDPLDWREPAAVAIGCALGAGGRWAVGSALDIGAASDGAFPWHTLIANLVGCLLIGVASTRLTTTVTRAFVVTGLLGGFTTMSAFGLETYDLSEAGRGDLAAAYVAASVLGGVAAVWCSAVLAERTGPPTTGATS